VVFAQPRRSRGNDVAVLPSAYADDDALALGLRAGHRAAVAALFDRHSDAVERVLVRVLGIDAEVPDLLQDVFVHVMTGASRYRGDASSLRAWLTQIAVRTARKCIRRRTTRRWLGLLHAAATPEPVDASSLELHSTLQRAQAVLQRMPERERIPFALRYLEGMQLAEVAEACEISLATAKRRLVRARDRFSTFASRDSVLSSWLEEAER
jgi:RNA polymerase sigma-70 factor (ECF subfamily)